MPSVTIPAGTIVAGTHDFAVAVPVGSTTFGASCDMTSYPTNQTVTLNLWRSDDNGATYPFQVASVTRAGGGILNDGVIDNNISLAGVNIGGDPNNVNRKIKGQIVNGVAWTTAGGSVSVQ